MEKKMQPIMNEANVHVGTLGPIAPIYHEQNDLFKVSISRQYHVGKWDGIQIGTIWGFLFGLLAGCAIMALALLSAATA